MRHKRLLLKSTGIHYKIQTDPLPWLYRSECDDRSLYLLKQTRRLPQGQHIQLLRRCHKWPVRILFHLGLDCFCVHTPQRPHVPHPEEAQINGGWRSERLSWSQ